MDFLAEIIEAKRRRLADVKAKVPYEEILSKANDLRFTDKQHRFSHALRYDRINIIAEFKRRSPSKGEINAGRGVKWVARNYETAGAAAISVLTEEDYFGGSLDDLYKAREETSIPILRKDFIFDEYQVFESYVAGADALLLIVAALDDETLTRLLMITEGYLQMDALVEVHTKEELERAVRCGAKLIGVNNRDLSTFEVSTATSFELARLVPQGIDLISESGLTPKAIRELRTAGYNGFLVGEALMRSKNPMALRHFILESTPEACSTQVKICGITNLEDAQGAIEAGADMLGFNFYSQSPRFIEPHAVREIRYTARTGKWVRSIGVFVNESLERLLQMAGDAGVEGIQLHGDETPEFCRQLKAARSHLFLIKAFASKGALNLEQLSSYPADAIMIDAFDSRLRGGTGQLSDWEAARAAAEKLPHVFLAGGLSPENVGEAIATVRPYGVDACSALELSPGKKDQLRVKEFVAAVRASKLPAEASAK